METKSKKQDTNKVIKNVPKRLVRSKTDRVLAGVCAGIGQYFEIDPIIVRMLFLIIAFTAGSGVLIYIILWIVIPEAGDENLSTEEITKKNSKEFEEKFESVVEGIDQKKSKGVLQAIFGLGIMFFGVYLIASNFGLDRYFNIFWSLGKLWPVIIIFLGFYILLKKND